MSRPTSPLPINSTSHVGEILEEDLGKDTEDNGVPPGFTEITQFCELCSRGDLTALQERVTQNPDIVHWKDMSGYTPLHWACHGDQRDVVQFLLDSGADMLAQGPNEETPFHWAAQADATKCIPIIVDRVKSLLGEDNEDDEEELDRTGEKLDQERTRSPKYLRVKDIGGLTPTHYAAQSGSVLVLHYLFCNGEDANVRDNEQHTPLHWAAFNGHLEVCLYLTNRSRCDLNAIDVNGCTPLHWAVIKGHAHVVQHFLTLHANITILDHQGFTPKKLAMHHGWKYIQQIITRVEVLGYHIIDPQLDQKPVQRYLVLLEPMFIQTILFYAFVNYSVISWEMAVALGVVMLTIYKTGYLFFPSNQGLSPYAYGHVVSAICFHWALYELVLKPYTWDHFYLHILIQTCLVFYWYYIIRAHLAQPGYYQGEEISDVHVFKRYVDEGLSRENFCTTCLHRKPLRCKHCKACNKCSTTFDHHCPWVDNCVATPITGSGSHYFFIMFLIVSNLMHLYIEYLCIVAFARFEGRPTWYDVIQVFLYLYNEQPFFLAMVVYNDLHHLWEAMLLAEQIRCIIMGVTVNEWINRNRYEYIRMFGRLYYSDFDNGAVKNLLNFFCKSSKTQSPVVFNVASKEIFEA